MTVFNSFNGTSTLVPQYQTFTQVLDVNVHNGIKETWKVWNDDSTELGVTQTIHTGTTIEIAGQTIDIEALNGQSFDRQYIQDNKAEILAITDSVNYDFDEGIESLSNVNIIYDGDYKVNLDYADGGFVNYLEIDPTITNLSGSFVTADNYPSNSGCTSTQTRSYTTGGIYMQIRNNGECGWNTAIFDTTSIPDVSSISDVELEFTVSVTNSVTQFLLRPFTPPFALNSNPNISMLNSGDQYGIFPEGADTTGAVQTIDLGADAVIDLTNGLASDTFGFTGNWYPNNSYNHGGTTYRGTLNNVALHVTWALPAHTPSVPTSLVATDGLPIGLSWNAPTDTGNDDAGNALPLIGYDIARTTSVTSLTELPDNSGSNGGLDFTDNELLFCITSIQSSHLHWLWNIPDYFWKW